jgi:signal transduction histidine kinase/ligand-binding sensor domain-containing protein
MASCEGVVTRLLQPRMGNGGRLSSACAQMAALTLGLVCALEVRAHELAAVKPRFVMASWTEQDGLPSNQVEALAQTPDGYLWVGTQGGLVRFDGVRFTRVEVSDNSRLPNQGVSALHTGRDGSLWVGFSGGGGTSRIDRLGGITHYGPADGLTRGRLHAIVDTADGTIWAGGLGGLSRLRHERWLQVDARDGFSGQTVISLYEDRRGNLWVGADAGVFVRRTGSQRFERHSASLTRANGISEDPNGSIWISTPTGVFRELGAGGRLHPVWPGGSDNYFRLKHDRHGHLWVATLGGGLLHVPATAAGNVAATTTRLTVQTGLAGDLIWALFDDREGNIWIGTQTGLARLTPSRVLPIAIPGPSRVVRAVESTRDGSIWAATPAGLIRFLHAGGEWREECVASCSLDVTALHADRNDTLWVAALSGLYRYERGRLAAVAVRGATQSHWIVAMTRDHQGSLWIRERNGRLLLWRAGELSTVDQPGLDTRSALALYTDSRGDVWVGFVDGGIVIFPGGNVDRPVELDAPDGSPVHTFFQDEGGMLWIGSATSLSRFENGRMTTLALARTGLPGIHLSSIVDDDDGNLWLGVRAGIVRLDIDEFDRVVANGHGSMRYQLLDTADGLSGSPGSIGRPAAVRGRDGTLAFITGHSVSMVSPGLLADSQPAPTAWIEGVVADQRSFPLAGDLLLPPRTNRIQIDYTAMTLVAPERVRFRYRLEGFDEDWVDAGHSRQAIYTNLPPGLYRFHVAARNKEGVWSDSSPTLGFVVQPSFYQTTWFIGGGVVLAGAGLWGAWLLRVRRLRRGFALVLTERARVAREIHDTLLQTLVGLTLKIDAVEGQIDSAQDASSVKRQLSTVRRQLQRSIRETRESIRDLRSHGLARRPLAAALQEAGSVICGGGLSFELAVDGHPVRHSRVIEEQLLRIAQESLTNVVRHAEARTVRVDLRYSTTGISLRVADDGRGFDPDESAGAREHWGVMTMRERAAQIQGELDIRSRPCGGTVVEVSVPVAHARPSRSCEVDGQA